MSYFGSIYADKNQVIPGVGTIHSHCVGSTAHTTGHDHYFLADGAEKPVMGSVRFSAFITEDGNVAWRFVHATGPVNRKRYYPLKPFGEHEQQDFPSQAIAEMRRISESLHETDRNAWFFSALGAFSMEIEELERKLEMLEQTITHLGALLAKPQEPQTVFVPSIEAGGKGSHRPASDEERAERRALWSQRVESASTKRDIFLAQKAPRLEMLRRKREGLRTWAHQRNPKQAPHELLQAA